jgi:hypothetical protein
MWQHVAYSDEQADCMVSEPKPVDLLRREARSDREDWREAVKSAACGSCFAGRLGRRASDPALGQSRMFHGKQMTEEKCRILNPGAVVQLHLPGGRNEASPIHRGYKA